jgi:diguanylate cyclase
MPHSNFKQLSDQQIEDVITMLDAAAASHRDWLTSFHAALLCNTSLTPDITHEQAHTLCSFGHWYYNQAPEILKQQQVFLDLEQLHADMHASGRLLALKFTRQVSVSAADYHAFIETQRTFSDAMKVLRDQMYERLYSYDKLTGLMTRGPFINILEIETERRSRTGEESCLVMMDIDHFKQINDNYGHLAGDRVLVKLATYLRRHIRLYDSICRYGGEEFLLLLPNTTLQQAHEIMERLRVDLEQLKIQYEPGKSLHVTSSFGIATLNKSRGYQDSLKNADDALYKAKASGRNRVCIEENI